MKHSRIIAPIVVLGVAALGARVLIATSRRVEPAPEMREPPAVRVMMGKPADVRLQVRSQGTVVPRTESTLIPEISGRVMWVSPALVSGGFFDTGDVLLRIDAEDYQAAVDRARAALARSEGEVEHARTSLARQRDLAKRSVNSGAEFDDARLGARVSEANLAEARVALKQAERDLARTELVAPFSGRVRDEQVDVGQFVARGSSVATLYATDYVEVRLPVPDAELAFLDLPLWQRQPAPLEAESMAEDGGPSAAGTNPGPRVTLMATFAGREHRWPGRVVRTEGEIDTKSRMVNVVARVEHPYRREADSVRPPLAVGLFVRAVIDGPLAKDVIEVPRAALRGRDGLLVVDAESRLHVREIELVRFERDRALVRVALGEGERICVSPVQVVVDGMSVRSVEVTAAEALGEARAS